MHIPIRIMPPAIRISAAALCAIAWVCAGCGPEPVSTYEPQSRPGRRAMDVAPQPSRPPMLSEEDAVAMVRTKAAEDTGMITEEWVRAQLDEVDGQILFPLWDARRRGANKYEVRFTYTVLYDDYRIEKRGFAWHVNPVLRLVGPPRVMEPEEETLNRGNRPSVEEGAVLE